VKRISSKHDTVVMMSTAGQQIMRRFLSTGNSCSDEEDWTLEEYHKLKELVLDDSRTANLMGSVASRHAINWISISNIMNRSSDRKSFQRKWKTILKQRRIKGRFNELEDNEYDDDDDDDNDNDSRSTRPASPSS